MLRHLFTGRPTQGSPSIVDGRKNGTCDCMSSNNSESNGTSSVDASSFNFFSNPINLPDFNVSNAVHLSGPINPFTMYPEMSMVTGQYGIDEWRYDLSFNRPSDWYTYPSWSGLTNTIPVQGISSTWGFDTNHTADLTLFDEVERLI